MDLLWDALCSAWLLLISGDRELLEIVLLSVQVSSAATFIASCLGVPGGLLVAFTSFPGRRFLLTLLNTLLAMPTVVIGLLVYSFISRRGLLGHFELLYTPEAIVLGQVILIVPVVMTLTIAAVSRLDRRYRRTALTLGAGRLQLAKVVVREAKYSIFAAVIAAFGRVIAEVGISMMLGGNARGFTRTMTTAMALEYDKGSFVLAVALGITLLSIAFLINMVFHLLQGRTTSETV